MSSSLQKQLAAIAATSTHQLDLKAQKQAHGKSLLFEPRVAANQDFNTIYQICHEGFEELCALDGRFAAFAKNLFSEQSKDEDRTQMTKMENQQLDIVLEKFLGLVGSRLLLKPAVKAVEWLVRRFRIHEYNTESTILTFLPYHATPIFPTLLSILPAQVPHAFRFLHPYISSLANPPRQTIVYTAIHTPSFFAAIQQYVMKVLKDRYHATNLLSFWASTTTQAIDGMLENTRSGRGNIQRQREEDLLLRILPVLNEGLTFKDVPEVVLGCYMIITVLVSKGALEEKVLSGLMEAVAGSYSNETLDGCLVCLAVIAQEREELKLPKSVQRRLLRIDDLTSKVLLINSECRADRLAAGCALAYINKLKDPQSGSNGDHVLQLLESGILETRQANHVLKRLFKQVDAIDPSVLEVRTQISKLITALGESPQASKLLHNALEEQTVDLDLLELKLQTIIKPAQDVVVVKTDNDIEMADAPTEDEPSVDAALETLPSGPIQHSFLSDPKDAIFEQVLRVYLLALASHSDMERFSSVPVLAKDQAFSKPTYISFYLRMCCGQCPTLARTSALQSLLRLLTSTKPDGVDLQALVPFLLCSLSDASANVRRAAAECIVQLNRLQNNSNRKSAILWGEKDLYKSARIKWLGAEESSKLLTALIPSLEECILDSTHITEVIELALNGPKSAHPGQKAPVELKSSLRSAIFTFLAGHAVSTPLLSMRLRLLSMLSGIGKSGSASRVSVLLPAVREWCSQPANSLSTTFSLQNIDLKEADRQHFSVIQAKDPEGVQLLKEIISQDAPAGREGMQQAAFDRIKAIWPSLRGETRLAIANFLLDLSLEDTEETHSLDRQGNAMDILQSVRLPSDVLVHFVESVPSVTKMSDGPPAAKRRRRSSRESGVLIDSHQASVALRRLTLVLELVEGSEPENHPDLLRGLFHLLDEVQKHATQTKTNLVYLQGLIIGSLLSIVDKLKDTNASEVDISVIRADLLVDCVRNTDNPQVQNSALLLISSLAAWMPELVLHSVMPIFTFMGSSLLRQSDDYSAHVIDQTISRVVPPLAASLRKQNRNVAVGVDKLLLSFTAAFEHIPLHRRLGLFEQLAKTLGPDDSLFAIVAMLVDKYPTDSGAKQFVSALLGFFDATTSLTTARRYLDLVEDALQPKSRRKISEALFSLDEKDESQVERTLLNLISCLAGLLDDTKLRFRISKVLRHESAEASSLKSHFTSLVEKIIQLSQRLKEREGLYNACSAVLSSALKLLPTVELIQSVETLLVDESSAEVRRVALKAITIQVRAVKQGDGKSALALLNFLPRVNAILQTSSDVILKHVAVTCIDQISERFGKKATAAVEASAAVVAGAQTLGSSDDRLRVMSLLCLASIVEILQDNFIPLLPQVMPKAFSYLDESIRFGDKPQLHNAVYSLLCSLLERVPFIFSGNYLETALELSHQSAAAEDLSTDEDDSREQFFQLVAKQPEAKPCFSAIEKTWESATVKGHEATRQHLELLHLAVTSRPKSAILKNTHTLYNIFLHAFDLRRIRADVDGPAVEELEHLVDEAAIAMTMKLNDATFRPFFIRLVDWAAKGLPASDSKSRMLRATSLYLFLQTFFDRLKSIVTSYSSYLVEHASELLSKVAPKDEYSQTLCKAVLKALEKSFEHDQDDFWQSPSHFSAIFPSLLHQLTVSDKEMVVANVIPTITALAAAAASTEQHKDLNGALLKLMRSDSAATRLAAVKCERELTERLGEDWLGLLPEMLPFISELQEDDDEQVEQETLKWIKRIEEILGESLEGMLQ